MASPIKPKDIFAKYIKEKDPNKAHAVLSASGSERWLGCPGSIRLSEDLPSVDTEAGIEGTHAHTLLQFILENYYAHIELLAAPKSNAFKKYIEFSDHQYQSVMVAVNYVHSEQDRLIKNTGHCPELHVEKKVYLDKVGFGTADIILYQPFGLLHVMDYKNGRHTVEPKNNTQGLYYAYAAADLFGWDFKEVWITIIQPNAPNRYGPIRTWKTTPKRLEEAGMMLKRGAAATKKKDAPLVLDSKWCYFCQARQICPKQRTGRIEKIMTRFEK